MKKILLFAALAFAWAGTMNAQAPKIVPNEAFAGLSPNGNYAVSIYYDYISIHDLATGQVYSYDEGYTSGSGNVISNTGIVVGATSDIQARYWKNGEWHEFESVADRTMSKADGITSDGTRIVGSVAPENYGGDYEGLMMVPCYWDVNADGTPGEMQMLPYPATDLTGRVPQYVTAIRVSDNGKIIAGQVQDYSGFICQPIVYNQGDDGSWTYTLVADALFHPEGIELPEDPGEGPSTMPEDFMTPEELAAYEQALDDWNNAGTWDWDTYPNMEDYMGAESLAAYQAALAEWEEWNDKWTAFSMAFEELCNAVPTFVFNNVLMPRDGHCYATTDSKESFDFETFTFTAEYTPYVFPNPDVEQPGGSVTLAPKKASVWNVAKIYSGANVILSSITDDGVLLGQKPASMDNPVTIAYIAGPAQTRAGGQFVTLYDYIADTNPSLANWMKENMTHEYVAAYDWDTDTYITDEVIATGIPFANADLSLIATAVENFWFDWENEDPDTYVGAYGYLLAPNYTLGVAAPTADGISVKGQKGGILSFSGQVASAVVYDVAGAQVYAVEAPAATVATGLGAGVYVVKATAANGTTTTAKVAL